MRQIGTWEDLMKSIKFVVVYKHEGRKSYKHEVGKSYKHEGSKSVPRMLSFPPRSVIDIREP